MPRIPLICANWKMNPVPAGALERTSPFRPQEEVETVVFPTALDIRDCIKAGLTVGAQCGLPEDQATKNAHTGDHSMPQLKEAGCTYVLCGHSERRRDRGETDAVIAEQVRAAVAADLHPILCVGETLDERSARQTQEVVRRQILVVLETLDRDATMKDAIVTVAYEPRWAIGTGKTPTAEEIREVHRFIHDLLTEHDRDARVLYGGSLKGENAAEILGISGVDGGLIGGASLNPEEFGQIVGAALAAKRKS